MQAAERGEDSEELKILLERLSVREVVRTLVRQSHVGRRIVRAVEMFVVLKDNLGNRPWKFDIPENLETDFRMGLN